MTDYSGIDAPVGAAWKYAARALLGLAGFGLFALLAVLALWAVVVFLYSQSLEGM